MGLMWLLGATRQVGRKAAVDSIRTTDASPRPEGRGSRPAQPGHRIYSKNCKAPAMASQLDVVILIEGFTISKNILLLKIYIIRPKILLVKHLSWTLCL